MTIPNPEHFLEQAEELVAKRGARPARQVDIRRAISAAYYGLFHAISAACADQFVGAAMRSKTPYALVYRALDHKGLRDLCEDLKKTTPPTRYQPYLPAGGLGSDIGLLALSLLELQEQRHSADYDPLTKFKISDASAAIRTARAAAQRLRHTPAFSKQIFLILALFPPRR